MEVGEVPSHPAKEELGHPSFLHRCRMHHWMSCRLVVGEDQAEGNIVTQVSDITPEALERNAQNFLAYVLA